MRRGAAWLVGVLLLVSGCSSDGDDSAGDAARTTLPGSPPAVASNGLIIEMNDNYFRPKIIIGTPGQAVRFHIFNEGGSTHNFSVTEQRIDQDVAADATIPVSVTFPGNGELAFFCKFHEDESDMVGTFRVA